MAEKPTRINGYPECSERACFGTLTWYWGNYGSVLQAYALQQAFILSGRDNLIIRHDLSAGRLNRCIERVKYSGLMPLASSAMRTARCRLLDDEIKAGLRKRGEALDAFVDAHMHLTRRCYEEKDMADCLKECDVLVCGSDQIWNPAQTAYSPVYWLGFAPSNTPRFSYAASMGTAVPKNGEAQKIRAYLSRFEAVSVREKASAELLNSIAAWADDVVMAIDPTLLVDRLVWSELSDEFLGRDHATTCDEPYLFAYLLRGSEEQYEFVESVAAREGLKLVTYPLLEPGAPGSSMRAHGDVQLFDDGPDGFISRIRKADCVITDSFHCAVFSIVFGAEFYVLRKTGDGGRHGGASRLANLLAIAGLEDRLLEKLELVRHGYDHAAALNCIDAAREESAAFFEQAASACESRAAALKASERS